MPCVKFHQVCLDNHASDKVIFQFQTTVILWAEDQQKNKHLLSLGFSTVKKQTKC
jgi:hypothetical protein